MSFTASDLPNMAISATVNRLAREPQKCASMFGPGYRIYFTRRGKVVYLLLLGGDKSSQKRDIERDIELARALEQE